MSEVEAVAVEAVARILLTLADERWTALSFSGHTKLRDK